MEDKGLQKGNTTMLLLELLQAEDMYGYQMIKKLEQRSNSIFSLKEGTLYPILHQLEKNKMVESYNEETASLRKRKYYKITDAGKKLLEKKKKEWAVFSDAINQVLGGTLREQASDSR